MDKLEPHHYGALERAKAESLAHAARITAADPMDYDACFPADDAEAVDEIIAYLKATEEPDDYLHGWKTGYNQRKEQDAEYISNIAKKIDKLHSALEVQTQLLASATEQLNAMRAERDRYKAWHDDACEELREVVSWSRRDRWSEELWQEQRSRCCELLEMILPQPLKENE